MKFEISELCDVLLCIGLRMDGYVWLKCEIIG
jgi:hypothetical protein